ncbi:MAG: type II secretion system F family protein [Bacteroidota bacterium]
MHHHEEPIGLVDLTAYLRQFSIMINAGVSLMRCLHVLDQSINFEPLRLANQQLQRDVEGGETLSKSMCSHPQMFTPFLIGLVRAGEIGGVLDDTMMRAAGFYERQLHHRRERFLQYATAQVLGEEYEQKYEQALTDLQDTLLIEYFCYMFGTMLGAGVPLLQAMEVAAEILPERLQAGVMQARVSVREGASIGPAMTVAGFPGAVVTLLTIGEETGALDRMALRAGDILEAQAEARLQVALGLN